MGFIESIEPMQILSGFILGLLGSMHCVGMCGPIALAIPHRRKSIGGIATDSLAYNFGRVSSYAALGALLGLLGFGLMFLGVQSYLSITIGAIILLVLILPKSFKNRFLKNGIGIKISSAISPMIRKLMKPKSIFSIYFLGVLNGLLPCGLVYFAMAGSLASGTALSGALFMAFFGIGTIPAMASLYIFKSKLSLNFRNRLYKIVPYGLAVVATLMILRGLSLDLPFISPNIEGMFIGEPTECLTGETVEVLKSE